MSIEPRRALRIWEVQKLTGLSRRVIYRLEREGKFCRRFKISERSSVWWSDEVQAYLETRAALRSPPATHAVSA